MVIQAQAAWETQLCLQVLSKESCVPAAWDVNVSQENSFEWHWQNNQSQRAWGKPPFPVTGTQHQDWHTHTRVHTLVWWITTVASHQISTSMTWGVYHYSQEVNPWAAMQNIPSQCQQDFQTPSHCHATGLVTYFKRTDVFQLLENFWDVPCWIVCSGNFFLCAWVPPALVRQCVPQRKAGIFKRQSTINLLSVVCKNRVSSCCCRLELHFFGR